MGRNVKILTLLFLSLFSFNLLAGADKKIQNVGSGGLLFQTSGANTRMSIDSSGSIFMPAFTDTRFLIFGPSGKITESATFTSATVTTDSNTQTLTNKTIVGGSNTISGLIHGTQVDNPTSGVHGATGSIVGTTDAQTLTNKTIAAGSNTITGLTHGSEVDNLSSGIHGVTGSVVGTTDTQVLTNKDFDGGSASNTLRITLPKNTKANLDGLSRKEGTIVYATDDKKAFIDNGANLVELGGAGTSSKEPNLLDNAGFLVTSTTSAMTIALKQADGSSDPTVVLPVSIAMRGSSDTVGVINIRTVESSLSLTIPDGATLGTVNAVSVKIYIYAIDNAGTVELAIGNIKIDGTESLINTTILNTSSDSFGVLYSTVARSNVPIRVIGFFESTQATAGAWASSPTLVGVGNHLIDVTQNINITSKTHDCWFEVANNGTATIQYDDGCISSVSRIGAGSVDVTFNSSVSGKITCICLALVGDRGCSPLNTQIDLPTNNFRVATFLDATPEDRNFAVHCSWR